MKSLQEQVFKELTGNVLPFWLACAHDKTYGGCLGEMDAKGVVNVKADKSVILHARLLWSYSESYLAFKDPVYLSQADQLYQFMISKFIDQTHQGVFSQLSYDCLCHDEYKSIVAQAYAIFSFATYYQASKSPSALAYAKQIMALIESRAKDEITGRYSADLTRNWQKFSHHQYSDSPSTYLHLIESYTVLLKCETNEVLSSKLTQLIEYFIENIVDHEFWHVKQNFALTGNVTVTGKRYGHDLEAAYLLVEAAKVLNNADLRILCEKVALSLIEQVINEHELSPSAYINGIRWGVNINVEVNENHEESRMAWVQAEALSAFSWAFNKTQKPQYQKWLLGTWFYITHYLASPQNQDWFECRNEKGDLSTHNVKIGPWKCPYHAVRGCINFLTLLNNEKYNVAFSQAYADGFDINKNKKEAS